MTQINTPVVTRCTNEIEIRAFGLQRSGNHAVITWIAAQYPGKPWYFLNNVKHGDHDPYQTAFERLAFGLDERLDIEDLRALDKHLIIYSYEDDARKLLAGLDFLESVFDSNFEANRQRYLKTSRTVFDVLIIRDPFNFFASRIKKLHELPGVKDLDQIAHNWKQIAQRAVAAIQQPQPGFVVANFNRWFADRAYREELSRTLYGNFNDSTKDLVQNFGGGSSFEGCDAPRITASELIRNWKKALHPNRILRAGWYLKRLLLSPKKGSSMKVTQRWNAMSADDRFRRVFLDREIVELSRELFGDIPGTEEFIASIKHKDSFQ